MARKKNWLTIFMSFADNTDVTKLQCGGALFNKVELFSRKGRSRYARGIKDIDRDLLIIPVQLEIVPNHSRIVRFLFSLLTLTNKLFNTSISCSMLASFLQ